MYTFIYSLDIQIYEYENIHLCVRIYTWVRKHIYIYTAGVRVVVSVSVIVSASDSSTEWERTSFWGWGWGWSYLMRGTDLMQAVDIGVSQQLTYHPLFPSSSCRDQPSFVLLCNSVL